MDFRNNYLIRIYIFVRINFNEALINATNMKKIKNLTTFNEFKEKNFGKRGTKERDELEAGYDSFKIGALIHDTRLELGMKQEELAEKVGTTKSYISKIENNLKETRISTLQKIVELGFGGRLELSIKII